MRLKARLKNSITSSKLHTIPENTCVFDIETDGFLDVMSKIHSLVIYDVTEEKLHSYSDNNGYESIAAGLDKLSSYSCIVGHNIIGFDIPAIKKLHDTQLTDTVLDTYNMSTLIYTELTTHDYTYNKRIPDVLKGSHKLEAWGARLGVHKADFGKTTDWKQWSKAMQDYCEQDVTVNVALFRHLVGKQYSMEAIQLETDFQKYITIQEQTGVTFDVDAARALSKKLKVELSKIDMSIAKVCPPTIKHMKTKDKVIPFNAGSRDQIVRFLMDKYKWKPENISKKTRKPLLDSEVMETLTYPEVELFKKRFAITNLQAKLETGEQSWLKYLKGDKIHGRVITNGAVSGRCTHASPNLAQVTSPRKPFGKEARALFTAPPGMVLVGADASGLELRCLAHYLHPYDNGRYTKLVTTGDPHTANQKDAGLPDRDAAKRFIYAFNYGAGDELIGSLVNNTLSESMKKELGRRIKAEFLSKAQGFSMLLQDIKSAAKTRGYLVGVDGRRLLIRSEHMALNTLLQGAGAVIMKKAAVLAWSKIQKDKLLSECLPVLNVHDEIQMIAYEHNAPTIGDILVSSIQEAGEYYNFKCPLDGQYKVGKNWMETH